jgi:hypothetical protein
MQVTDLIVEVRDASLNRVAQLTPSDLVGAKFIIRFNALGSWELRLRGDSRIAALLRQAGAGLLVTGPNGVIMSGPTIKANLKQTTEDPIGTWELSGLDDSTILFERLAYPTPSQADVAFQSDEYDVRTGKASTVMYAYVNANIGPGAPTGRKISNLVLTADTAIGSTVSASARFDTLDTILHKLAQTDQFGYKIVQDGTNLRFTVYDPADLSASIRMDIYNNRLITSDYGYTAPQVTRAIVGGSGDGTDRVFQEVTTTDSTASEAAWGRRIEQFIDGRSSNDPTELVTSGVAVLNQTGMTITGLSVAPSEISTMRYQVDWNVGDTVSVVVGSDTVSQIVQEVGISIETDGVRVIATVGFPEAIRE